MAPQTDSILEISLQLDDGLSQNAERIRILEMDVDAHRVEKLVLSNPNGDSAEISLVSVFSQVEFNEQRFKLAAGSDSFGRLVVPI